MDTYSFLRELADSWVLLILALIFLGVIGWAFRPGSRALHDDAASVPFRHDEPGAPAGRDHPSAPPGRDHPSAPPRRDEPGEGA